MKYLLLLLLAGCSASVGPKPQLPVIPIDHVNYASDNDFRLFIKGVAEEAIRDDGRYMDDTQKRCQQLQVCLGLTVRMYKDRFGYNCYIVNGKKKIKAYDCED